MMHLSNLSRNDGRCVFALQQFGPDEVPRLLAHIPTLDLAPRSLFNTGSLGGAHFSASRQALPKIGLDYAGHGSKPTALSDGVKCFHDHDSSESLHDSQAIRLPIFTSELLQSSPMETANERRLRKLRSLVKKHGRDVIADKAGVNAQSLDQILKGVLLPPKADGSRSPRSLGDAAARAIEDAFNLGRGWFDAVEVVAPPPPLSDRARQFGEMFEHADAAQRARFEALMFVAGIHKDGEAASRHEDRDWIHDFGLEAGQSEFSGLDELPAPAKKRGSQ